MTGKPTAALRRKTGILVHGYNLHAGRWEDVAWGAPPDRPGRVPMGVFVALCDQADAMVFGSGASKKDGLLESEATAGLMRDRFDDLAGFSIFKNHLPEFGHPPSAARLKQRIESILRLDTASRNTREEIAHAGRLFVDQDIDRVILVSSPTHLPRCLRDACAIFGKDEAMTRLLQGLCAAPSVTGYPGCTADDVAIFEPPHRPDRLDRPDRPARPARTGVNISSVVARVHDIPDNARERFVRRLDELLLEFEV